MLHPISMSAGERLAASAPSATSSIESRMNRGVLSEFKITPSATSPVRRRILGPVTPR
jgi:hypothetical protein